MSRRYVLNTSLAVILSIMATTALAATITWDAEGGDSNWSTAANWSGDSVPTASDVALFDGTGKTDAVIDQSFVGTIHQLQLASTFTGSVILNKNLIVNDQLMLSGGTLDMRGSGYILIVKDNWVNDGAVFQAGTGTVMLTGTGSSHTLKESNAFYNVNINDGLIGYWKFDDASGDEAADSSGWGKHGALMSGMSATGWTALTSSDTHTSYNNPYALEFDGADDFVSMPVSAFPAAGALTASMWFKIPYNCSASSCPKSTGLLGYSSGVSNNDVVFRLYSSGLFGIYWTAPTVVSLSSETDSWVQDQWYHVAFTFDETDGGKLYVNGSLEDSDPTTTRGTIPPAWFYIGRIWWSAVEFEGVIDDVRTYSRALTSSEVAILAQGSQLQTATGTYILGADLDVDGDLSIITGNLDQFSQNYTISLAGNMYNNGNLLPRGGNVILDGTSQSLSGSTTFYNLTKTATSTDTITFNAGDIFTMENTTTLQGRNGDLLSLRSSSIGSQWTIDPRGTRSIEYVNVQDSRNTNFSEIVCPLSICTNNGNNSRWVFSRGGGANAKARRMHMMQIGRGTTVSEETPETDASASISTGETEENTALGGSGKLSSESGSTTKEQQSESLLIALEEASSPVSNSKSSRGLHVIIDGHTLVLRDVPSSSWFAPYVQQIVDAGIASGYKDKRGKPTGEFGPGNPVTYAEIAKMALNVVGKQSSEDATPKNRIARNQWSAPYIALAEDLRLTVFHSQLDVNLPATRGAVLQTLTELFEKDELPERIVKTGRETATDISYIDLPTTHPHAEAVKKATVFGWVQGDTDDEGSPLNTFRPDEPINRAEVTKIIALVKEAFR